MSTTPVTAVLTCRRGDLAGSTYELGEQIMIGRDAAGRMVVTSGSRVHTCDARIFAQDGACYVENLGEPGHVVLDGEPVRGTVALSRLHVIELGDVTFMYSQRAVGAASTGNAMVSATPTDGLGTTADAGGFDAIPTLRADAQVGLGTVVDPGAFDAIPSLARPIAAPPPVSPADDGPTRVYAPPPKDPPLELRITLPGVGLTTFPLKYGENVIGRGDGCDIRLHDPEKWLSRKHALLKVADDRVELVDLKGSNGTFVHGARITPHVYITTAELDTFVRALKEIAG